MHSSSASVVLFNEPLSKVLPLLNASYLYWLFPILNASNPYLQRLYLVEWRRRRLHSVLDGALDQVLVALSHCPENNTRYGFSSFSFSITALTLRTELRI